MKAGCPKRIKGAGFQRPLYVFALNGGIFTRNEVGYPAHRSYTPHSR